MLLGYVETGISDKSSKSELKYRETEQDYSEKAIKKWIEELLQEGHAEVVQNFGFYGDILELGAGHCWFPAVLSKIDKVKRIYALEYSSKLLKEGASKLLRALNANERKIVLVHGDFYNLSWFKKKNKKFDFIVFSASLHHAEDPVAVLLEAKSVLKKDGKIVCIREPFIPYARNKTKAKEKFGRKDKEKGVTENTYTIKEWKEFFDKTDTTFEIIPIFLNLKSSIFKLETQIAKLLKTFGFGFMLPLFHKDYIIVAQAVK